MKTLFSKGISLKTIVVFVSIMLSIRGMAGNIDSSKLYNPSANAEKDIVSCIKLAKQQNKHVLIQAGGNWCVWCLRFNKFIHDDKEIDSIVEKNFVVYHLNYSKENKNDKIFAKYQFPQRFGFPVFIILDAKGNKIHTQNSAYLEDGKGYSKQKVIDFFNSWTPEALNPNSYKN